MKELLIQSLVPFAFSTLIGVITPLASLVLLKVKTWVGAKTKNEALTTALERVTHTTETVVAALNQSVVPGLKAAASDGKLTKEDAANLKSMAMTTVMLTLKDEIKANAELGIQDINLLIGAKIEQAVGKLKTTAGV